MKDIFDIVEKRVIINPNILLIPQFKAIVDKYEKNYLDVFCFIYYFCYYKSPFSDYKPEQKEEILMTIYNKDDIFTLEDEEVIEAIKLFNEMQWTPTLELLEAAKCTLFRMADYLRTTTIIDGRDGNLTQINSLMKQLGATVGSYDQLKEQVEKEKEKTTIRGGKTIGTRER